MILERLKSWFSLTEDLPVQNAHTAITIYKFFYFSLLYISLLYSFINRKVLSQPQLNETYCHNVSFSFFFPLLYIFYYIFFSLSTLCNIKSHAFNTLLNGRYSHNLLEVDSIWVALVGIATQIKWIEFKLRNRLIFLNKSSLNQIKHSNCARIESEFGLIQIELKSILS